MVPFKVRGATIIVMAAHGEYARVTLQDDFTVSVKITGTAGGIEGFFLEKKVKDLTIKLAQYAKGHKDQYPKPEQLVLAFLKHMRYAVTGR